MTYFWAWEFQKLVWLVQVCMKDSWNRIWIENGISDPFKIYTGLREGCGFYCLFQSCTGISCQDNGNTKRLMLNGKLKTLAYKVAYIC